MEIKRTRLLIVLLTSLMLVTNIGYASSLRPPYHPSPNADQDMDTVKSRGDIASLPGPLMDQIVRIAGRPPSR
jgi:hypothetical protein